MEEVTQTLEDLGLTRMQIKILLFLEKFNRATVKDISKSTGAYRQEIYPALHELQKIGLIERIIGIPNRYKALSLDELLRILLERKTHWMSEVQKKTTALIKSTEIRTPKKEVTQTEYDFTLITGLERIGKALAEWQNPAKTADFVVRFDRFDYQLGERIAPYTKYKRETSLRLRVITCQGSVPFGTEDAEVRFTSMDMPAEISIYDGKRAHLGLLYDRTNAFRKDVTVLTSNHPSFVKMLQDYFDLLWENSKPEKPKNKKSNQESTWPPNL